jgi:hypothetical protein
MHSPLPSDAALPNDFGQPARRCDDMERQRREVLQFGRELFSRVVVI